MICEVFLSARDNNALPYNQMSIAKQCEILMRGLAHIGITALVDEATGFQYERARNALAEILEKFIAKELAAWVKTFDDEYYKEICRLKGLDYSKIAIRKPQYFGHYTNNIVYKRLAPGILEELKQKNPTTDSRGNRKAKHHQWLTPDMGHPKLREHLAVVTSLMKISDDWSGFILLLNKAKPQYSSRENRQLLLPNVK
jgi:hypothetical protein